MIRNEPGGYIPIPDNLRAFLMCGVGFFFKVPIVLLFCVMVDPPPARAHPHAWIDLRSAVVLNESGHVIAIEQQWFFDPLYTVFATDDLTLTAGTQKKALTALARINLQRLHTHGYFTEVRMEGAKIDLGRVSEFESDLREGRLWMRFVVPLVVPIDPTRHKVSFAVFDPTYYVEILHLRDDIVSFRGSDSGDCYGQIIPPKPTTEAILWARAMDRDATPDATLGKVFAEQVEITCY